MLITVTQVHAQLLGSFQKEGVGEDGGLRLPKDQKIHQCIIETEHLSNVTIYTKQEVGFTISKIQTSNLDCSAMIRGKRKELGIPAFAPIEFPNLTAVVKFILDVDNAGNKK